MAVLYRNWQDQAMHICWWLQVPVVAPSIDIFVMRDVMRLPTASAQQQVQSQGAAAGLRLQLHADPSAPDRLYAVHAHGGCTMLQKPWPSTRTVHQASMIVSMDCLAPVALPTLHVCASTLLMLDDICCSYALLICTDSILLLSE